MYFGRITFVAAVILSGLFNAPAQAETLHCKLTQGSRGNWVAPDIFVEVDKKSNKAVIVDAVLQHLKQSPKTGKVMDDTDKRLLVTWVLKGINSGTNQYAVRIDYRLNLNRKTGSASVRAVPAGYANDFYRRGSCAPVKKN